MGQMKELNGQNQSHNPSIISSGIWMAFRLVLLYMPSSVGLGCWLPLKAVWPGATPQLTANTREGPPESPQPQWNGGMSVWGLREESGRCTTASMYQAPLGCLWVSHTQYASDCAAPFLGSIVLWPNSEVCQVWVSYLPSTLPYIQLAPHPIEDIRLCLKSLECIPISSFPPPLTRLRPAQPCSSITFQQIQRKEPLSTD